mmetsp:Transcript_38508/g.115530  ORF Transcript_38508/g.115530 Transcript_38508/m.115530 type:complete len:137 (+) Transcript_38508:251-661(+)
MPPGLASRSSGWPISATRPRSSTTTLFTPRVRTHPRRCVTMSMHLVVSMAFVSASTTTFSLLESRAAVGSSKRSTSALRIRLLAMATLCLCPPLSVRPPSPTLVSSSSPRSFFVSPVTGSPLSRSASATASLHPSP